MEKIYCVISHTHWDREWYMPQEKFRMRLVDLIDNLLKTLEEYPNFIFHLDAQTIVLEDYLEIRPYNREKLKKYITSGNILVGPWYVQNDFYLTSGESTIRNIIAGSRIAADMGKCTYIGYAPDQFGIISQLPQILNGFGMDSCIFGRGYDFFENVDGRLVRKKRSSEFIWKGPDGSSVLAIHLPFWYNNAQRFSEDINKSMKLLNKIKNDFEGIAMTPYLLLMNGVDHLEAQENLLPIIEKMNDALPENEKVVQYTMDSYVKDVAKSIPKEELGTYEGELRNGTDYHVLAGTLSSRVYIKKINDETQNMIENNIEHIYSFINSINGCSKLYPADYLKYMWKLLMQNHPHDSICGCSRDEVYEHMTDRYSRVNEVGDSLLCRGMDFISSHISRSAMEDGDYLITLYNTLSINRNSVVDMKLQFPSVENVQGFRILDENGKKVSFVITKKYSEGKPINSPINLPGMIKVDSYMIEFYVDNIEPLSYRSFVVKIEQNNVEHAAWEAEDEENILENEHMIVKIMPDGKVDLYSKDMDREYKDILKMEDGGDCGESYVYAKPENDRVFLSDEVIPSIGCSKNTPFEKEYILEYDWMLPEGFNFTKKLRSEKLINNKIKVKLSLKKGCRYLKVAFDIDNKSKDHRLRALIPTGVCSDFTQALSPFDIIKRDRKDLFQGIKKDGTQPDSGFVDINDGTSGLSILNNGLHEYEHINDSSSTIAITLLRATGYITQPEDGVVDETWLVPGNQCIRDLKLSIGIYPHGSSVEECMDACLDFQNNVLSYFQPSDLKKFSGGRPAVQDSEIEEIFYRKDDYEGTILARSMKFFDIRGKGIVLSALKRSENGSGIIIRAYNIADAPRSLDISCYRNIKEAYEVSLDEKRLRKLNCSGNAIQSMILGPKKIFTVELI